MVRAILDDRKTVTRRVIKVPPSYDKIGFKKNNKSVMFDEHGDYMVNREKKCLFLSDKWKEVKLPYQVGDILYIRETWQLLDKTIATYLDDDEYDYVYKAHVNGRIWEENTKGWAWRPSIHMPKEAARIFLKVTGVKVERLQDITEEQARKEGVGDPYDYQDEEWYERNNLVSSYFKDAFFGLWDSLLPPNKIRFKCPENEGKTNPWVWVIEFERCEMPASSSLKTIKEDNS